MVKYMSTQRGHKCLYRHVSVALSELKLRLWCVYFHTPVSAYNICTATSQWNSIGNSRKCLPKILKLHPYSFLLLLCRLFLHLLPWICPITTIFCTLSLSGPCFPLWMTARIKGCNYLCRLPIYQTPDPAAKM